MEIPGGMTIQDYNQDSTLMSGGQHREPAPHIEFKIMPVEDRQKSEAAGRMMMKDEEFMFISTRGGKDVHKKAVPAPKLSNGNPNPVYVEFMDRFGRQYEHWKRGQEIPVEGTDLRNFPLLSPAQIENCRVYNIYSVEQLAEATEEALKNIGMGSRKLKMTAQRWLEFGDSGGKSVARIDSLESENATLKDQLEQLVQKVDEMEANQSPETKRGPGRPKGS